MIPEAKRSVRPKVLCKGLSLTRIVAEALNT